ncbi:MAG TPA: hypothetical protein VNQ90_03915 [Chthoniobacteraceae bacterium]|nr:hypothetical protein [Chthoniobacteraceae bacterium]
MSLSRRLKPFLALAVVAALSVAAFCAFATSEKVVFPIGGYSGDPARDQAAGFTVAGPTYGDKEELLAACEAIGMPLIYNIGMPIDFLGRSGEPVAEVDFDEVRREIRRQVEAVADREVITTWYLTPEELRNWKPLEMEYLQVAAETIRSADPRQRPVWMYEPGHRTHGALAKTAPFQDILGKGVYTNYAGRRTERTWVAWTLDQQARAIAEANPTAIPYGILEMFKRSNETWDPETVARWVRHDAYASLVSGVKGIVIFSFGRRPGFYPGSTEWDAYYHAWSAVAGELNGSRQLGAVFLKGQPVDPPAFEVVEGSAMTLLSGRKGSPTETVEVPSFTTTAFRWKGKTWWFVVNSSEDPLAFKLPASGPDWKPLLEGQPDIRQGMLQLPPLAVGAWSSR